MLFFEKTLLLIPLVAGLMWMFGDGGVSDDRQAVAGGQVDVAGVVGPDGRWLLLPTPRSPPGVWRCPPIGARWRTPSGSHSTAPPSPRSWGPLGGPMPPYPFADPPGWWVAVSLEALAVLIIGGILMYRRASRAWLVAGAYCLATVALYAFSRVARDHGTSIAIGAMRYTADALLPMLLAIGMSVMPLRGGEADSRRASRCGPGSRSIGAEPSAGPSSWPTW